MKKSYDTTNKLNEGTLKYTHLSVLNILEKGFTLGYLTVAYYCS